MYNLLAKKLDEQVSFDVVIHRWLADEWYKLENASVRTIRKWHTGSLMDMLKAIPATYLTFLTLHSIEIPIIMKHLR
ncbi:MAG: hypothetical protein A3A81_03655 [Omnitrophica bacterium RIFCSPLOWO2_01_FULL_45_10b]|nr:MAG: hypothetical protein A3A81_03655 [Omnitrophica bacterium RIFCSPLOWO2_01_FULL_45_10b]